MVMEVVFWGCLGLIAVTYLLYPGMVMLAARWFPHPPASAEGHTPSVSMVISAYNEEDVLDDKIQNCRDLDYPAEKIEFLLGSDGSDDATNSIINSAPEGQFKSFVFQKRRGKSAVLNDLVPRAQGEIVLFSDANSLYHPDAVRKLTAHFHDPEVGGVCGKLTYQIPQDKAGGEGEGMYWQYENRIKQAEGALSTVISANGAILALRKSIYQPLPVKRPVNDDMMLTLQCLEKKLRVIFEPEAAAVEQASAEMGSELARKIRISALNFNALPAVLPLLHPRFGFTALALFAHKLLRWSVPFLGAGMLISNLALASRGNLYLITLAGQGLVYLGAALGYIGEKTAGKAGPFLPFYYLAMINLALVIGLWKSLADRQTLTWE